ATSTAAPTTTPAAATAGGRRSSRRSTAAATAEAASTRSFDKGVGDARILSIDVHHHAAERARWEAAAGDTSPGITTVRRLPHAAAGATTVHAARGATALVRRGENGAGIAGRRREIG